MIFSKKFPFLCFFILKNLVMSKKCSNFANRNEKTIILNCFGI